MDSENFYLVKDRLYYTTDSTGQIIKIFKFLEKSHEVISHNDRYTKVLCYYDILEYIAIPYTFSLWTSDITNCKFINDIKDLKNIDSLAYNSPGVKKLVEEQMGSYIANEVAEWLE